MNKSYIAPLLASSMIAISSSPARAYPIFYKCDANRGLSELLSGSELNDKLKAFVELPKEQKLNLLSKACDGLKECERQLGQIVELAEIDRDLAQKTLESELQKLQDSSSSSPIRKISSEAFELQKALQATYFHAVACRSTIETLPPEKFLTQPDNDDGNVLIYFPYDSEYTYVTGCRPQPSGALQCDPNQKSGIKSAIRSALIGGADPYVYLALGLMESGANGWSHLYLDPIGKMKAMGCREEKTDTTQSGDNKLKSFGNFHKITVGSHSDPALSERLKRYLSAQGHSLPSGKSYFCRNLTRASSEVFLSPEKNHCCLELGFNATGENDPPDLPIKDDLEHAFVIEHVKQVQNSQLPGKSDPAFRLQHFNGFSKLMGGAEQVSTFRTGVNYYDDPAYGYQAMDYIINSLATNPWIRSEVERQSKDLHVNNPSILCMDVPVPGVYQVDSDSYFKKHHDTPRMNEIRGKTLAQMKEREKKVFLQELDDLNVHKLLKEKLGTLPTDDKTDFEVPSFDQKTTVKLKDGTGLIVHQSSANMNSEQPLKVEKIGNYKGPIPQNLQDLTLIGLEVEKAKKGFSVSMGDMKYHYSLFGNYTPSPQELQMIGMSGYGFSPADTYKIIYSNGISIKVHKKNGEQKFDYFDSHGAPIEQPQYESFLGQGYRLELPDGRGFEMTIEKSKDKDTSQNPDAGMFGGGFLGGNSTKTIQYSDGTEYSLNTESLQPNESHPKPKASVDREKEAQTYWNEIYSTRNTISKASPLPWTTMSDSLLKRIAKSVRNNKNRLSSSHELKDLMGAGQFMDMNEPDDSEASPPPSK